MTSHIYCVAPPLTSGSKVIGGAAPPISGHHRLLTPGHHNLTYNLLRLPMIRRMCRGVAKGPEVGKMKIEFGIACFKGNSAGHLKKIGL